MEPDVERAVLKGLVAVLNLPTVFARHPREEFRERPVFDFERRRDLRRPLPLRAEGRQAVLPAQVTARNAQFIAGGESELQRARFVQTPEEICAGAQGFAPLALPQMLDALAAVGD